MKRVEIEKVIQDKNISIKYYLEYNDYSALITEITYISIEEKPSKSIIHRFRFDSIKKAKKHLINLLIGD